MRIVADDICMRIVADDIYIYIYIYENCCR